MLGHALLALFAGATIFSLAGASDEGVYLANCQNPEPGIIYSEMAYYSNAVSGSQDGQQPDATAVVPGLNYVEYVTWEGQQVCATFSSSGETFCSNISSDGESLVSTLY